MTKIRIGTMMLALGLAVGGGSTIALRPAAVASAAQSMGDMNSKSAGDMEMNRAMSQMAHKMAATHLSGVQDRDFMMMMIAHHQSAVDMARIELRRGTHQKLKSLARDIIRSQTQEILQMHRWLKNWYGQSS